MSERDDGISLHKYVDMRDAEIERAIELLKKEAQGYASADRVEQIAAIYRSGMDDARKREDALKATVAEIQGQLRILIGVISVFVTGLLFFASLLIAHITH